MKRIYIKFTAYVWTALMVFVLCSAVTNAAEVASTSYAKLAETAVYKSFCTIEQPHDALVLMPITSIDTRLQTSNYARSVFNLPRLRSSYYYSIPDTDTSGLALGNTVYPTLMATKDVAMNAKCTLQICSKKGNSVETEVVLIASEDLPKIESSKDCSASFSELLYPMLGSETDLHKLSARTTYYNSELHKYGLVTSNHMILSKSVPNMWLNSTLEIKNQKLAQRASMSVFDETAYMCTLPIHNSSYKYSVTDTNYGTGVQWKFHEILSHDIANDTDGLLLYVSNLSNFSGNVSSGTITETAHTGELCLIAMTNSALYAYSTKGAVVTTLDRVPVNTGSNNELLVKYNESFDLRYDANNERIPYMNPVASFPEGTTTSEGYKVTAIKSWNEPIPVISKLPGGALQVGIAAIRYSAVNDKFTISFNTNGGDPVEAITATVGKKPSHSDLPVPVRKNYAFAGWFTDEALTTKYSPETFSATAGGAYTLYAKWEYAGGTYTVVFIDRKRNTSNSVEVQGNKQPTFPTISSYQGYSFKSWEVLNSVDAATGTGTPYSPDSFSPEPGRTYYFNALFATSGTIKSVTNKKATYFVNDTLEKGYLDVTVQLDDAGSTKVLDSSEYTVEPTTFTANGVNTFVITYTATGATYTLTLTAIEDAVGSISATYTGESLTVGSSINKDDIRVTQKHKSGKTKETTDFTFTPATVASVGVNNIRVTSGNFTTTVQVTGIRMSPGTTSTPSTSTGKVTAPSVSDKKALSSISASYIGGSLTVGDNIRSSDISVSAMYSDGSVSSLDGSMFTFTPSYVRKAGTNTITVVYGGKTTTFSVDVKEAATGNVSTDSRPKPASGMSDGIPSSTTGTAGEGMTSSNANTKTTSKGYLNGNNILNNGPSSSGIKTGVDYVNNVDILKEIQSSSSKASSMRIELINNATGNTITDEMFDALKSKGIILYLNMVDGNTGDIVGEWKIDCDLADKDNFSDFDPNIVMTEVDKYGETMILLHIDNNPDAYESVSELLLSVSGIFSADTTIHVYKTSKLGDSSEHLKEATIGYSEDISIPLSDAPYYVLTNQKVIYESGSNLVVDTVNDMDAPDDVLTDIEEEEEAGGQEIVVVSPSVPEKKPASKSGSLGVFIIIIVMAVMIAIVIVIVIMILNRRRQVDDVVHEDEIEIEEVEEEYDYTDTGEDENF